MKQLFDIMKNSLKSEFEIDVDNDDITLKLIHLSNDPVKMDIAIKLMAEKLESKLQYEGLLNYISQQKIKWQLDEWILSMLESQKSAIVANLPDVSGADLESIVSVSTAEPKPEEQQSNTIAGEAEQPAINERVKMYLDGRLRFSQLQRGFEVELINGSASSLILRKTDSDYMALSSRLLNEDYLLQIAEIMVKNAPDNSAFTIHLPPSMATRKHQDQKRYVSMMQDALIKAGAPKDAIKLPIDLEPKAPKSEQARDPHKNAPLSKEDKEFVDRFTGTNIKNRFFKYLDRDKKSPSKNPWINFETLCKTEGARVVKGMIDDGFAWAPNAKLADKVFAINKYIDDTMRKNPDDYFGVIAVESDDGGIAFKPDSKPFAMTHVYDIEATEKQLNMIKKLGFADDVIDDLVEGVDVMVEAKRRTAAESLKQEYEKEAATQPQPYPEYYEHHMSEPNYSSAPEYNRVTPTSAVPKDVPNDLPPQPSPKVGF